MSKKREFKRRTGKVISSGFEDISVLISVDEDREPSFYVRILEAETYLNDKVATEIHRRFNIAVRFHL